MGFSHKMSLRESAMLGVQVHVAQGQGDVVNSAGDPPVPHGGRVVFGRRPGVSGHCY
jgi:hypothetical protein